MAKEINEKTFELNITNQLLDISRSFFHYMEILPIHDLMSENEWFDFFTTCTFFAEGLTQAQETNPHSGGYDVSINYASKNGNSGRLLFLQYKSGDRANYCKNTQSKFHGSRSKQNPHIIFKFNDAAGGTQHSTLRNLANRTGIQSKSVLYVFPRITERALLISNITDLILNTSFVPVLDIDKQAHAQIPPITIINGTSHNYRTSYDGITSEVNYFFYGFNYEVDTLPKLISELICVQIERLALFIIKKEKFPIYEFSRYVKEAINRSFESFIFRELILREVTEYLVQFQDGNVTFNVPQAPQKYTTIIPIEGLILSFDNEDNLAKINYQII
jgi:hypothetical protein